MGKHNIHMPRYLMFMLLRAQRRQRGHKPGRIITPEGQQRLKDFWTNYRKVQREHPISGASIPAGGSGSLSSQRRNRIPEQPQGNGPDLRGRKPAAGSGGPANPVKTGWYFYADGVLFEGYQTWEALKEALENVSEIVQNISEVKYHD